MTPKEKAEELFTKFIEHTKEWDEIDGYVEDEYRAKKCAMIAVDEILKITWVDKFLTVKDFWNEVKHEIEKI